MNKRQAKKMLWTNFRHDYKKVKASNRKSHEMSIALARKEHRNYWEEWTRGYPNIFRFQKWFLCK